MATIFYGDLSGESAWSQISGTSSSPSAPPSAGDTAYFGYYNGPGLPTSGAVGSDFTDITQAVFYQGPWTLTGNHTITYITDQSTGGITLTGTDNINLLGIQNASIDDGNVIIGSGGAVEGPSGSGGTLNLVDNARLEISIGATIAPNVALNLDTSSLVLDGSQDVAGISLAGQGDSILIKNANASNFAAQGNIINITGAGVTTETLGFNSDVSNAAFAQQGADVLVTFDGSAVPPTPLPPTPPPSPPTDPNAVPVPPDAGLTPTPLTSNQSQFVDLLNSTAGIFGIPGEVIGPFLGALVQTGISAYNVGADFINEAKAAANGQDTTPFAQQTVTDIGQLVANGLGASLLKDFLPNIPSVPVGASNPYETAIITAIQGVGSATDLAIGSAIDAYFNHQTNNILAALPPALAPSTPLLP